MKWVNFIDSILTPEHTRQTYENIRTCTANHWPILIGCIYRGIIECKNDFEIELKLSVQAQNPSANPKFALKGMTCLFFSYSQPTSEIFRRPDWLHFIITDDSSVINIFKVSHKAIIHFSNTHIQRWKNKHIFWS